MGLVRMECLVVLYMSQQVGTAAYSRKDEMQADLA